MLLVRTGGFLCTLPLSQVAEVVRPLAVERVAGAPAFVCGLSIIRGQALPVIDLGTILRAQRVGGIGRFVVLKLGTRGAALAVDSVIGIQDLATAQVGEAPPLLREAHPDLIAAVGRLDQQLLLVLELSKVIPEESWNALHEGIRDGE